MAPDDDSCSFDALRVALLGAAGSLLLGLSTAAQACASCGGTLTADWLSQGLAAQPGTTFTLRYA